jgi:hypothetical protein
MKPSEQTMDADALEPEMSHTSGNGSGSTRPQESRTLAIEPSGSGELADGKATGPRTEQGKTEGEPQRDQAWSVIQSCCTQG